MANVEVSDNVRKELISDADLLYPGAERKSRDRLKYMWQLRKYSNFYDWKQAEDTYGDLKYDLKNKMYNTKESKRYMVLSLVTGLVIGTGVGSLLGYCEYTNKNEPVKQINIKDFALEESILILLCVVAGLGVAIMYKNGIEDYDAEIAFSDFYRRLVTRYFKSTKPTKETQMLFKRMNPEMADIVTKILITNLPAQDVDVLQELATDLFTKQYRTDVEYTQLIQNSMKKGLTIIKRFMVQQPDVVNVINGVFKGELPAMFIFNNTKQNIR